ncbi:hypothetical protein N7475_001271 [Penicillium sp. IBT 31633x]|nr:hypothetical protein N7475_001271 [Penicillium sp. IBT 31633x]
MAIFLHSLPTRHPDKKEDDKSGIRTHAPFETRKLLLVVELRYTLTWRLGPTRPSYHWMITEPRIWLHERKKN